MFEESLVESTALIAQRNRWPAIASIGFQLLLAVALLSIPLVHPESILHAPKLTLVDPVFRRPQPPMPQPQRVHVTEVTTAAMAVPAPAASVLPQISANRPSSDGPAPDVPGSINMIGMGVSPIPALMVAGKGTGPAINVTRGGPTSAETPARISSGVSSGLLLEAIRPDYPQMAKITHTEGTVVVHAVISREGKIESAQVLSGPAMLQASALEAVRKARYRPYLLSGVPTEVETTFSIVFHMNN